MHDPYFVIFELLLVFYHSKTVKCILQSFLIILLSRGFTVAIFNFIFHLLLTSFLLIFLPNVQKVAKNEIEKKPKRNQKWLL